MLSFIDLTFNISQEFEATWLVKNNHKPSDTIGVQLYGLTANTSMTKSNNGLSGLLANNSMTNEKRIIKRGRKK